MRRAVILLGLLLAAPGRAAAQTYVAGAIEADVLRVSHAESEFEPSGDSGGETLGLAVRVGTTLGDRWGIEAELARSGEMENESAAGIIGFPRPVDFIGNSSGFSILDLTSGSLRPITYHVVTRQRITAVGAQAWLRQDLSSRVALVYVAGVAFYRSEHESEFVFDNPADLAFITLPAGQTTFTTYGVKPLVGLESRIAITDRIEVVPGVRLQGLESAWLVRPAVALSWRF